MAAKNAKAPEKKSKKAASKKAPAKKSQPAPATKKRAPKKEPTLKELQKALDKLDRQNALLQKELKSLQTENKGQRKQLASLEGKLETRIKREDIVMSALGLNTRSKKGDRGALADLNSSILKADEHLLKMGTRLENILSAIKNHREYLIRLNKKVYKLDPVKRIKMELDLMANTLSIMALSGFSIDKGLFGDMRSIKKMMEKEDMDLAKVKKRMATVERKFGEEMERFDFESIFKKAEHIPGYR